MKQLLLFCRGKQRRGAVKTALRFEHDEEDLTCLEQRLTQAAIDRVMGTDLLVRAAFHGQSDVTALLEVCMQTGITALLVVYMHFLQAPRVNRVRTLQSRLMCRSVLPPMIHLMSQPCWRCVHAVCEYARVTNEWGLMWQ